MSSANTELALVQRFHSLSQKYDTRPAIARRNTLPTLSRFLTSKEREIRKLALDAVHMLSQHPENVELLATEQPITEGVFSIYREAQYDDPELHELSSRTLDCLCVAMPDGDPRRAEVLRRAAEEGLLGAGTDSMSRASSLEYQRNSRGGLDSDGDSDDGPEARQGPDASANQSSHVVTFDLPALNPRIDTSDLEEILQKTKGVLSYTIAASVHQIRVFMASRAIKPLQEALNAGGYINIVVSDDRIARQNSVGSVHRSYYDDDAAAKRPTYLQSARSFASSLFNAVALYTGQEGNTLASRVQRQREIDQSQSSQTADRVAKAFANWW